MPVWELMEMLRIKLTGHYRYYGVTDNFEMVNNYHRDTTRLLYKWLNRRSQRNSFSWNGFNMFLKICRLPIPRLYVNIYL